MSLFLGLDIGGTKIAGGLVTAEGRVTHRDRCPTPLTGGSALLEAALSLGRTLLEIAQEPVIGIGIGTGGQVDTERGIIVTATDLLPGWAGTPVKDTFQRAFGLPCDVDNDVNALAVGEARFGAGRGLATVLYLALGTGVGGALLLNGRVHHGATWSGGEFGHLLLTTDASAPRKTLEEWAGGPGLVRTYHELAGVDDAVTGEVVAAKAARDPNGPAAQAVARTGECLGFGLAGLANVLDPNLIVIGGGLSALGETLLAPARRVLRQYALPGPARCPVAPAALGSDAAVIGAAALRITAS